MGDEYENVVIFNNIGKSIFPVDIINCKYYVHGFRCASVLNSNFKQFTHKSTLTI